MTAPSAPVFYNTLTKRRETFVPRNESTVRMFTCGPSVYRRQHMGNYRTFLFEDVLQRYLEFAGYRVERALNFTDVEDKAIEEAGRKGVTLAELTQPVIDEFLGACSRLGIKLPAGDIPRATGSVGHAVDIIRALVERGHAYWHDGNVYYDPLTYPGFGEVFGLDMSKWPKRRYRYSRDTYNGLRWNMGDFVLWHGSHEGDPFAWQTDIGWGRPSWNVQDPAMISATLGYEIDIHCGGIDNVYRHHDYNRAVMEGVSGEEFCHYWIHGEHLLLNGRKMSKSTGNVSYPSDLEDKGYSPSQIRFSLIYGYYRDRLNLDDGRLADTSEYLQAIRSRAERLSNAAEPSEDPSGRPEAESRRTDRIIDEIPRLFRRSMDADLHTAGAVDDVYAVLGHLEQRGRLYGRTVEQARRIRDHLSDIDSVLGVMFD